jgi:hypothetical protein
MDFKSDDLNPGVWFYFGDDEKAGGVCIRFASADKLKEIAKKTTTTKNEWRNHKPVESKKIDEDKHDLLLWDYCIVDWKNVNEDGKPIKCNAKNKSMLMGGAPVFSSFVTEALQRLKYDHEELQKAIPKN